MRTKSVYKLSLFFAVCLCQRHVALSAEANQALFSIGNAQATSTATNPAFQEILKRSPLGRYLEGSYSPGVKNFREDPRCVISDLENFLKLQNPPMFFKMSQPQQIFKDATPNEKTANMSMNAADFELRIQVEVAKLMNLYRGLEDKISKNREICLASGVFAAPNAISIGLGFMVFDPNLFFSIIRHKAANAWSVLAVVAHEFAHQMQFWHMDPFVSNTKNGRRVVREMELQADCAAAAMLKRVSDVEVHEENVPFNQALNEAFISLGDFDLHGEGHHGTGWERGMMVDAGIRVARQLEIKGNKTSAGVLEECRMIVFLNNQKYGDLRWPFNSPLVLPISYR